MNLSEPEKAKIKRFMMDKTMSNAVWEVIENSFLKRKSTDHVKDVHYLAAKSIAIEFLDDAFIELRRIGSVEEPSNKSIKQIGI